MTAPRRILRPARRTGGDGLPPDLVAWFSGATDAVPWSADLYPDHVLLPERWRAWKREHPDARPPRGWAWLDDPESPLQPGAERVWRARRMIRSAR
jgi:hypothetical protein